MKPKKALQLELFLQKRLEPLRYEIENFRVENLFNYKRSRCSRWLPKTFKNLRTEGSLLLEQPVLLLTLEAVHGLGEEGGTACSPVLASNRENDLLSREGNI